MNIIYIENFLYINPIIFYNYQDMFLVFLKDIYEQKDVRKHTDEMQLFLHDTRFFDDDKEVTVNAGAAFYPDNGKTVPDVLAAAEKALERSAAVGKGILSF